MKITLCGYFPIGFAIGTNDTVFENKITSLKTIDGAKLIERKNKQ